MARSRNDRIRRRIGKAIINGTLSSAGTITASGVGTTLHANFDSSGALLNSDSAGYADGSLHYLSKLKKMYVWDDSDGQFFELTGLDSSAAEGSATYSFQGSVSGYTSGGAPSRNQIDKFPFASDANATDVGDLIGNTAQPAGQSSTASGYTSGGTTPAATYDTVIQKFSFSADGNSTDVGDLTIGRRWLAGQSSENNGYNSGGQNPTHPTAFAGALNTIDKFPFAADANATDVGDMTVTSYTLGGQSSTDNGYSSGGQQPTRSNVIDKFPFSSDANATDVGNLTVSKSYVSATQSSSTHGYVTGGTDYVGSPILTNVIEKFTFATDGNSTDVGDLLSKLQLAAGQSSTASGYISGGDLFPGISNVIQKHSFSSDGNASDVGDLTLFRYNTAGQQV